MTALRVLLHLVRADFLERTRRYSFLITLGLTVVAAYLFLPASDARYIAIDIGGYRGVYNSAWIGSSVAVLTSVFLSLAGFYLVKNAVERDAQTGVGQILATTPLPKRAYTLGKALSNFAVLAVIVGLVVVASGVVQFVRGEDLKLEPGPLVIPFLVLTLPAVAVVAALAVLFEVMPGLKSGAGNVAYFFLFVTASAAGVTISFFLRNNLISAAVDPLGVMVPMLNVEAVVQTLPDHNEAFNIGPYPLEGDPLKTFTWEGMAWTVDIALARLVWVGVGVLIALLAAQFFDRFDPASAQRPARGGAPPHPAGRRANGVPIDPSAPLPLPASVRLKPLPAARQVNEASLLWRGVIGELRLMLNGARWWWGAGAVGLIAATLVSPSESVRQLWLPLAWVWPLLVWSPMGNREDHHNTGGMVFSSEFPLRRQFAACWIAGLIVALVAGSGAAPRLLFAFEWGALLAWGVSAIFIPSLALALGTWTGSSKAFEVIYLTLWYLGPWNKLPWLDFMGTTEATLAAGAPLVWLALAVGLLAAAVAGRRRQLSGSQIT